MDDTLIDIETVPGGCGSIGPFGSAEYCQPHVYARDITSGAGNCVCGDVLGSDLHTEAAPGIPVPEVMRMVSKAAEPQRFVLGIAYQAGPDPRIRRGVDGGRDYFTKAELEKAAWSYMASGRPQMNAFHVEGTEDCAVSVESFIWRWPDWDTGDGVVVKDGDWCLGAILSPDTWALHKAGKINGLSPEGTARRRKVAKGDAVTVAKGFALAADEDDEDMTELVDADFRKVAVVGAGANGVPRFLISKEADGPGLLPADYVRGLIEKTEGEAPVPQTTEAGEAVLPNGIVIKGSPADMAAFFSAARQPAGNEKRPTPADVAAAVAKADLSAKAQNDLPDSAFAYIESGGTKDAEGKTTPRSLRHFNISDKAHADDAAARIAQGAKFGDKAKAKVESAQRKFGEKVSKEAGMPDAVTKDIMDAAGDGTVLDDGMDGMDPTTPFAAPADEPDLPGDPTDPGSPAWEGIDAATAHKWVAIAARLKNALLLLAEREALEAASADPDDIENAWSLQDAADAVDYAIGNLAVFASGEKAEAEIGAETAEMCKALAGFDLAPLGVIEGLTAVAKAGRVLSSANEAKIRDAAKALGDVLSSLPAAPAAPDQPVAKETEGTVPAKTAETPAEPVAKERTPEEQARDTGPVRAGGTTGMGQPRLTGTDASLPGDGPQGKLPGDIPGRSVVKSSHLSVVVYDRGGKQCHVRPDAIVQPVAKADDGDAEKPKMQAVFDQDGDLIGVVDPEAITPVAGAAAAPAADPGEAPAPPADDMTPQPPADAGMAADAVGKAAQDVTTGQPEDLESIIAKAVATALSAVAPAQDVAKSADVAGALAQVELLKARLAKVEETPAAPGVFTNGAVPPEGARPLPAQGQLRGQDSGAQPINVAKAAELKRELYTGSPARQVEVAGELTRAAMAELNAIHAAPAR